MTLEFQSKRQLEDFMRASRLTTYELSPAALQLIATLSEKQMALAKTFDARLIDKAILQQA